LSHWERLSEQGAIDLFYGDECGVCLTPCIPYAWQFKDEKVVLPSSQGGNVSCFALLSRDNRCLSKLSYVPITARWIRSELDTLSLGLSRPTVVVLDNAPVHRAGLIKERLPVWQERGLFVVFLPVYSPQLNIAEVLWRKLKYEWLRPEDYTDAQSLHYAVWQALAAVGKSLNIRFSPFRHSLT
jgi:transposase